MYFESRRIPVKLRDAKKRFKLKSLKNCISSYVKIGSSSLEKIVSNFEIRTYAKGDYFLKAGGKCREMAFIESGYLRMYDIADGKEISLWIAGAGKFITSLSSFVFQTKNNWNIQCLTNGTLYVIPRAAHFNLCEEERKWLEFDNLLLANSFRLLEKSMFEQLHTTAQQRLDALMEEDPAIFNHVPLQHIASMIGIAPESLSRLRRNRSKLSS